MKKGLLLLLILVIAGNMLRSQNYLCSKNVADNPYSIVKQDYNFDILQKDSGKRDKKIRDPKTATLLAIIPGLGQIYNRKYWKIPIVYAGLAGFSAGIYYNQKGYKDATAAYLAETDTFPGTVNTTMTNIQSVEGLRTVRLQYRNYRDASIVGLALFYVLQMVDATVDAHFSGFDPDKPLSFKFNPLPNYGLAMAVRWQF